MEVIIRYQTKWKKAVGGKKDADWRGEGKFQNSPGNRELD